jgi:hypothetical protein
MIIEHTRKQYLENEPYWAANLMVELEKKERGKTMDWAIDSMMALVRNTAPSDQAQLLTWLSDLSSLCKDVIADSSSLREESQRIWHEKRDIFHTAIAHLYAALAYLWEQNISCYRTSVVTAMRVMGDHEYYRWTSLAVPLTLFENITKHDN